jgi:hypothetical protein
MPNSSRRLFLAAGTAAAVFATVKSAVVKAERRRSYLRGDRSPQGRVGRALCAHSNPLTSNSPPRTAVMPV